MAKGSICEVCAVRERASEQWVQHGKADSAHGGDWRLSESHQQPIHAHLSVVQCEEMRLAKGEGGVNLHTPPSIAACRKGGELERTGVMRFGGIQPTKGRPARHEVKAPFEWQWILMPLVPSYC